jgi:hypothetical protein
MCSPLVGFRKFGLESPKSGVKNRKILASNSLTSELLLGELPGFSVTRSSINLKRKILRKKTPEGVYILPSMGGCKKERVSLIYYSSNNTRTVFHLFQKEFLAAGSTQRLFRGKLFTHHRFGGKSERVKDKWTWRRQP